MLGTIIAALGLFFTFAAFVLLLLTSLSTPIINRIHFLSIFQNGFKDRGALRLGTWGYCSDRWGYGGATAAGTIIELVVPEGCSDRGFKYDLNGLGLPFFGGIMNRTLSGTLILQPIACGLAFLALVIGLLALCTRKFIPVLAFIVTLIALIAAWAAWACAMALFAITRKRIRDNTNEVLTAHFDSAIWMGLAAAIALTLAALFLLIGFLLRRRRDRRANALAERNAVQYMTPSVPSTRTSMAPSTTPMVYRPNAPVTVMPARQRSVRETYTPSPERTSVPVVEETYIPAQQEVVRDTYTPVPQRQTVVRERSVHPVVPAQVPVSPSQSSYATTPNINNNNNTNTYSQNYAAPVFLETPVDREGPLHPHIVRGQSAQLFGYNTQSQAGQGYPQGQVYDQQTSRSYR